MQNKIYLLCLVFLLIVVQSISLDSFRRIGNKDDDDDDKDEKSVVNTGKYNQLEDKPAELPTPGRHRHPSRGSSSNSYRSRSRLPSLPPPPPSPFDDRFDDYDWSPYGYGPNNMRVNLPPPFLPAPFEASAYLSGGPSCHSLLDPIYPVFSDICGSVPQARYSLPNAFGHLERWQIAQVLSVLLGPATPASTNPICGRSLRLLLCPLLFPPCPTRFEAPPVLPCQPFCRAVKNQCASPSLELLPCDLLPPTSDLCPINPTPYSSLLASFGPPSPFGGPLPPFGVPLPPFGGPLPPFGGPLPPFGGPQSALSSLLAQSALSAGFSPVDLSPSPLPALPSPPPFPAAIPPLDVTPPGLSPLLAAPGLPPPSLPAAIPPPGVTPPGLSPLFPPSGLPLPSFPGSLPPPGVTPAGLSPLFATPGLPLPPPAALQSILSPINPFVNPDPYLGDSLTPILVDFPPLQFLQGFPQASRYFPSLRSATEQV